MYDLPAMIKFITNMRMQSLHTYIGHSMGVTSSYIMALERPEIARTVKMVISLAPGIFVNHMKSPIKYFFYFEKEYEVKKYIQRVSHFNLILSSKYRNMSKYVEIVVSIVSYSKWRHFLDIEVIITVLNKIIIIFLI